MFCPICRSEKLKDFKRWNDTNKHRVFKKCSNCSHIFAAEFNSQILEKAYSEGYYCAERTEDIQNWINKNRDVWYELTDDIFIFKNDIKSILDFGAGTGGFLECFQEKSKYQLKIFGVENSIVAKENLHNRFPDGRFFSDLSDFEDSKFDCITVLQCFEHLDDPIAVYMELYKRLNADGVIVITVPNRFSWRTLLKQSNDEYNVGNPTHLQFFSKKSMCELLKKAGFTSIKRISNYPSSGTFKSKIAKFILRKIGMSSELRYICKK